MSEEEVSVAIIVIIDPTRSVSVTAEAIGENFNVSVPEDFIPIEIYPASPNRPSNSIPLNSCTCGDILKQYLRDVTHLTDSQCWYPIFR